MGNFNSILLKRQFDVAMSNEVLNKIISSYKPSDCTIIQMGNSEYKVVANVSFGVGFGFLFDGIKIYASLKNSGPTETTITFTTHLRIELYVLTAVSIIIPVFVLNSDYTSLLEALISPICLVWFWAVYRHQERTLADDFEQYLAKQPRMGWKNIK